MSYTTAQKVIYHYRELKDAIEGEFFNTAQHEIICLNREIEKLNCIVDNRIGG